MITVTVKKNSITSLGSVVLCCFLAIASVPAASIADSSPSTEQRLALLDFEILLLRSEIALRNGERGRFLVNMHELSNQLIPEQFQTRFNYLNRQLERLDVEQVLQSQFRSAISARDIVMLLPLSSEVSHASRAMIEEFEHGFKGRRIHAIDSDLYDDMAELWQLVKLFNPGLIIGPLERQKSELFYAQNPQIPAISFTSLKTEQPYLRSLASSGLSQINYLHPLLEQQEAKQIVWLTDRSEQSDQLMQQVHAFYQKQGIPENQIQRFYLEGGVDKSVLTMLGADQSLVRQNWLQATVGRVIETNPYVRSDKKIVIGMMPQSSAIQLRPMLNFYQIPAPFLWIPTQLEGGEHTLDGLGRWQSTYALFPAHLIQKLEGAQHDNDENVEVGLFRAMAKAQIKLVETAEQPIPYKIETPMGMMLVNELGHYQFMPSLLELNQGRLKTISLDQLYIGP